MLLSVWIGVGGCLWPISSRRCRMGIASRALMYRAPSSASAALDMTALSILEMFRTAPLLGGSGAAKIGNTVKSILAAR